MKYVKLARREAGAGAGAGGRRWRWTRSLPVQQSAVPLYTFNWLAGGSVNIFYFGDKNIFQIHLPPSLPPSLSALILERRSSDLSTENCN